MEFTISSKEIAEAIAAEVGTVTNNDCEAYTNPSGAVIVYKDAAVIARIMTVYDVAYITPVGGTFGEISTEVQLESKTIDGIRDIAQALDEAISHVINAAMSN